MRIETPTEHTARSGDHTTFYLAAGPSDGPPIIFVHGWPELSISWRHQLPCFAALGFRAIAPDMRGYGRSRVYDRHADYGQAAIVADMIGLLDALGAQRAVWVGHDWGCATVWSLASHHPERCAAVANLCVPYYTLERGLDAVLHLIDRDIYPAEQFPLGQWEYQGYYQEHFDAATAAMDASPYNLVKALFRKGSPRGQGKPAATAWARIHGGWFEGADQAPDIPLDTDVVSHAELRAYAAGLERNGFLGPNAYYMNHDANARYAEQAVNGGVIDLPALFLAARYDYTCESVRSRLAEPMRAHCTQLSERIVDCGHWMAQERPLEVNAAIVEWLVRRVPDAWPGRGG